MSRAKACRKTQGLCCHPCIITQLIRVPGSIGARSEVLRPTFSVYLTCCSVDALPAKLIGASEVMLAKLLSWTPLMRPLDNAIDPRAEQCSVTVRNAIRGLTFAIKVQSLLVNPPCQYTCLSACAQHSPTENRTFACTGCRIVQQEHKCASLPPRVAQCQRW